MAELLTKVEKDKKVYLFYRSRRAAGRTKTQAAHDTMQKFNILSIVTVYNIRKRQEKLLKAETNS